MTIIHTGYAATADSQSFASWDSGYSTPGAPFRFGNIRQMRNTSETQSVSAVIPIEPDLTPYECMRLGGGLAFWDKPEEDLYSFDDGQPA